MVFTTESGLTIGVYADLDPQNTKGLANGITSSADEAVQAATAMSSDVYSAISGASMNMGLTAVGHTEVIHKLEGKVQVEGVSSEGEVVAVMDMIYDDFINRLRREVRWSTWNH